MSSIQQKGVNVIHPDGRYKTEEEIMAELGKPKKEEEEVCCVGCGIRVCGFDEEPPFKDERDEAVCNDCWEEEEEVDISCIEDELDSMLFQENMDWGFDKPPYGKYETIYIFKRDVGKTE